MTNKVKSKQLCSGCEDNFYNGNNQYGIKECSHYESAEIVPCVIATTSEPPPFSLTGECLNCYRKSGYAYIKNFDKISRGKYKGMYCYGGDKDFWESKY